MKQDKCWLSVKEYAKRKGLGSPQVVYNWIALGKLKKGKEYREVEIKKFKKEVLWTKTN